MEQKTNSIPKNEIKTEQGRVPDHVHLDALKMQTDGRIIVDPFGSWTGVSLDNVMDTPVQDVDDL